MSKRSRDVTDGLKRKQLDDAALRGAVILGVIIWIACAATLGSIGFWIGMALFILLLIAGVADWWPNDA